MLTMLLQLKDLMVVGYDSYHDSLKKGMSVGGFVASLNNSLTKYYSKCTFQHNSQELLDQLIMCMIGWYHTYFGYKYIFSSIYFRCIERV